MTSLLSFLLIQYPIFTEGSYVHPQWTGSNTNPNNNAGQGLRGSDRSNIVQLKDNELGRSFPEHASQFTSVR